MWLEVLGFAAPELLEECCAAEGREFSHPPRVALPLPGIPLTIFVCFQSFFPVWRGEKKKLKGFLFPATE